ncbi:MAG: peptide deformylase [Deltaproteobacteria bacterium]|nr:peptide deformylase [Deltaproteobacteria bacterium]
MIKLQLSRRNFISISLAGLFLPACSSGLQRGNQQTLSLLESEKSWLLKAKPPLDIVQYKLENPDLKGVLRQKAKSFVPAQDKYISRLEKIMRITLNHSGGVGLAAPQIGFSRQMILVEKQNKTKEIICCLDPEIIHFSKEKVDGYEGCLSIKGYGGKVARSKRVEVKYNTPEGNAIHYKTSGWEARIFQHEIDHLNGILYIDRLKGKLLPLEELRKIRAKETAAAEIKHQRLMLV